MENGEAQLTLEGQEGLTEVALRWALKLHGVLQTPKGVSKFLREPVKPGRTGRQK